MRFHMNYGKLEGMIDALKCGDNIKLLSFQEILFLNRKDNIHKQIPSPFCSNKEYEETIQSLRADMDDSNIKQMLDEDKHIQIVFTPKTISNNGNHMLHIRKLANG
jgi:hypothetical protein